MELDELKYQLNKRLATDHASRTNADLSALLKRKTSSLISKLKRSLLIEMAFCIIFLAAMLYICFATSHWSMRWYFGVFSVLMVAFALLLYYLYQRTLQLDNSTDTIRTNLSAYINLLEEFVKRYFQFTMALLPICFTFSLLLSYADPIRIPEVDKFATTLFSAKWQVVVFLVVYMVVLGIALYYFTKWYLKKLYGNYLTELKQCMTDLED